MAWIVATGPFRTHLTVAAVNASAKVSLAGAVDTQLTIVTWGLGTAINHAASVFTRFAKRTADLTTAAHTAAITAELTRVAEQIGAWVRFANEVDTLLAFETARRITIGGGAAAGDAGLVARALNIQAGVYTHARFTDLISLTVNPITGFSAEPVHTLAITMALVVRTWICAAAPPAGEPIWAFRIVVDCAVAVIVESIADLDRHITTEATGVSLPFVDQSVAIVILKVADLFTWGDLADTVELPTNTRQRAHSAESTFAIATRFASADRRFVGCAITIVVEAITDFVGGCCIGLANQSDPGNARLMPHFTNARLVGHTLFANREAFIGLAITIVVKAVTDFFARELHLVAIQVAHVAGR